MKKLIFVQVLIMVTLISFSQEKITQPYLHIPIIDLDRETFRQVVVDRHVLKYTPDDGTAATRALSCSLTEHL